MNYELIIKIYIRYLFTWILSDYVNNNSSSWLNVKKE